MDIIKVAYAFDFEGDIVCVQEFGSGHINSTFIADSGVKKYVIQKINTNVFKDVDALMNNVFSVTEFLKHKIEKNGGDPERKSLNFVKTKDGKKYYRSSEGECFRAYVFVSDSVCYDSADTPEMFKTSGKAFGCFQKMLSDFPADTLKETIPHFHDTFWRYENEFLSALDGAKSENISAAKKEIEFVKAHKDETRIITDLIKKGEIPLRVTHNDTKLNNILFDKKTGESLAVIDLDTVMPGSALYDFGDSIRFGASTAAEDEKNLERVEISLEYFKAYADGFLSEAGDILMPAEKKNLAFSAKLITFECGMRFLTDYLNGNTYFKTDYPGHNLVRAKNQFKLVADMEKKADKMNAVINEIIN